MQRKGEGFESHWDDAWFRDKAMQCRQLASCVPDAAVRATLVEMATEFDQQGDVAQEAKRAIELGRVRMRIEPV